MDPNIPSSLENNIVWKAIHMLFDDSDEEASSSTRRRRKRANIDRNREEGHARLFNDYFADQPVYTNEHFRRRFRMHKHVFMRIVDAVTEHDDYFLQKPDATGKLGHTPLQKCTSAIRMLAYGASADSLDEYVRMAESTSLKCLDRFTRAVCNVFGGTYLRKPNNDDVARLLQIGTNRGFPGMLGSIDCMHWEWKNCPVAWKGQFSRGDHGCPTVMLEAVASADLWIWHAFFGVAGCNNDINVLNRSDVFNDVLTGQAPKVNYTVNHTQYNMGYYLADGIYPQWAVFVKTLSFPQGDKRKFFTTKQEGFRKDIERAFGVLQQRFAIIRCPARQWHLTQLSRIIHTCIILHNMIVEDERNTYGGNFDQYDDVSGNPEVQNLGVEDFPEYLRIRRELQDRDVHQQLQADLIEHVWNHHQSLPAQR